MHIAAVCNRPLKVYVAPKAFVDGRSLQVLLKYYWNGQKCFENIVYHAEATAVPVILQYQIISETHTRSYCLMFLHQMVYRWPIHIIVPLIQYFLYGKEKKKNESTFVI